MAPSPEGSAKGGDADAEQLLFVSWNVAGWTSAHGLIDRHYAGVDAYMERLGSPAFFCAQETKVQSKDLKNEVAAQKLGAALKNYKSYWAFNESPKNDGKGVATWVRNDIPVDSATQVVLGIPEFDQQGRVLLTEHGALAVLNVYAPFAGPTAEPAEVQAKLRFLRALGDAADTLRGRGKRVVICGDLNLTHRREDQRISRRLLLADDEGRIALRSGASLGPFKDWAGQWQPLKEVSARAEVSMESLGEEAECLHIREAGCVPWFRSRVQPVGTSAWADIFAEVHPEAEERFTTWSQSANHRYSNLGTRIDYIICDRSTFQDCVVPSASDCLVGGRRPGAAGSTSSSSAGAAAAAEKEEGVQAAGDGGVPQSVAATSAAAALNAATNFGGWHATAISGMAQGDGLGLQADDMRLNHSQFPSGPHTGLIYTPPAYSDHIALSAVFRKSLLAAPVSSGGGACKAASSTPDVAMKRCRPWLAQPSIASFFGGTPRRSPAAAAAAAPAVPALTPPPTARPAAAGKAAKAAPAKRRKKV